MGFFQLLLYASLKLSLKLSLKPSLKQKVTVTMHYMPISRSETALCGNDGLCWVCLDSRSVQHGAGLDINVFQVLLSNSNF